MLFPHTIQHFFTRLFVFLSAAFLLLIPAVAIAGATENKTNGGEEILLVSLPLKFEDTILTAIAGSGENEGGEENRNQNNRPAGELSNKTPDNSGENFGNVGAEVLGAAVGALLGTTLVGTGNYYNGYQQGPYTEYYGGNPYGVVYPANPVYVSNPGYLRPPTVYRPPRPDSYYPGPGPAYGDYFDDDAADGLAGFGGSYPGYYSELLVGNAPAPHKVTPGSHPAIATVGSSSGQKKPPTTGGSSGYPIDWSAVAEAYYQDVSSRTNPSSSSHQTETEEELPIFVSDSYPLLF